MKKGLSTLKILVSISNIHDLWFIRWKLLKEIVMIDVLYNRIAQFCKKWQMGELSLFGSALRDDFGPESDIDILVAFDDDAELTLFDLYHMKDELREIFDRNIDLVSRRGLESSRNHIRRDSILNSAEALYAA